MNSNRTLSRGLVGIFLVVWGCASAQAPLVEFDPGSGQTVYQSPKVLVGNINMTGGLASGHRVMMQAFASCAGRECKPNQVEIAFYNDSSADLNLDYRRVEITFGSKTLEWEDVGRLHESMKTEVPRGEFTRVPVSRADFAGMASAQDVQIVFGLTGTTTLRVPLDRRAGFRDLVEALSL
jgi:hypothetical protein